MNPDEDIVLNIGANTVDVESALGRLHQEINHAFNSSNAKVRGYGIQLDKVTERIEKQTAAMKQLASQRFESDSYKNVVNQVAQLRTEWEKVDNEVTKMFDEGKNGTELYEQMSLRAEEIYKNLQAALATQRQMEESGARYISGKDTEQYTNLERSTGRLITQAGIISQRMHEAESSVAGVRREVSNLNSGGIRILRNLGNAFKNSVVKHAKDARRETKGFGDDAKMSFKKALNFLIRYGIGMASLFRLYRRLRVWTKEAMTTMGKAIPEVGQQIIQVANAAVQLKNSLATVAQPIFSYLLPAIQTVISALVTAMNTLANFFAMLTGQGYIYKAAKGNKKLADSIGGAGKAAKEAKEEIAEYDKLIVLDQPNAGGGGGGAGGAADDVAGSFEKVDGQMTHFIQDIQKMWSVFKQAWQNKGKRVMDAWHRALGSVKQLITDIWHTIVDVFTDGTGLAWVESLLELFATVLDTVYLIASAINTAWNKDNNGYKFVKSILTMWTSMQDLVRDIIDSWNRAWSSDNRGVKIIEHILHIFTLINESITVIAEKWREAWNKNDNGLVIFQTLLDIINSIAEFAEDTARAIKKWAEGLNLEPIVSGARNMLKNLKPVIDDLLRILRPVRDAILLIIKAFTEVVVPVAFEVFAETLEDIHGVLGPVSYMMSDLADALEELFGVDFSTGNDGLKELWRWLQKLDMQNKIPAPIRWIADLYKSIKGIYEIIKKVDWKEWWDGLWNKDDSDTTGHGGGRSFGKDGEEVAKNVHEGFKQGLKEGFEDNYAVQVISWCDKHILQPIKDFFEIGSPSKLMKRVGKDVIQGFWNGIYGLIQKLEKKISKWLEPFTESFDEVVEYVGGLWDKFTSSIKDVSAKFKLNVGGVLSRIGDLDAWRDKFIALTNVWKDKASTFKASVGGAISKITDLDTWKSKFSGVADVWKDKAATMKATVSGALSKITDLDTWKSKMDGLRSAWADKTADIKATLSGISNISVLDTWKSKMSSLRDSWVGKTATFTLNQTGAAIQTLIDKITSLKDSWKDKAATFSLKFSAAASDLKQWVNTNVIDKINSKFRSVPILKNHLIPHLASGAVIPPNKEFLAVLGDQKKGTNIEAPLDTIVQAFRTALREDGGGASNNAPIVLQLNGRTVAEAVWDETEKRYKQKGISGVFAY